MGFSYFRNKIYFLSFSFIVNRGLEIIQFVLGKTFKT